MVVDLAYGCSSVFPVHGQTEKAAGTLPVQWRLRLTVLPDAVVMHNN
jgi:hypothetical protein